MLPVCQRNQHVLAVSTFVVSHSPDVHSCENLLQTLSSHGVDNKWPLPAELHISCTQTAGTEGTSTTHRGNHHHTGSLLQKISLIITRDPLPVSLPCDALLLIYTSFSTGSGVNGDRRCFLFVRQPQSLSLDAGVECLRCYLSSLLCGFLDALSFTSPSTCPAF